jgi:SAM-dependent methyltransferase
MFIYLNREMLGLDAWQSVLLIILLILCMSYLCRLTLDRLTMPSPIETSGSEGFTDGGSSAATKEEWLLGDEIIDDFYMSVYHKIFQHDKLVQAEAALALHDWQKKMKPKDMAVLDLACGSGVAATYFAKQDVGSIIGIDKSPAAIRFAKNSIIPATTLTPKQREALEFRIGDLYNPSAADPASATHSIMTYFSVYVFRDLEAIFKNIYFWTKPGGSLAIEVVNRDKFEVIPDVTNPWVGTTPQAHAQERITKATAVFDKFEYSTEFDLDEERSRAEFKEIFRFKDGTARRQKHILYMPKIEEIVRKAQQAGWVYEKYSDLRMIGFPYGYMLFFNRA